MHDSWEASAPARAEEAIAATQSQVMPSLKQMTGTGSLAQGRRLCSEATRHSFSKLHLVDSAALAAVLTR